MSNLCDDTWTGKDKVWHFGISLALAVICPVVAIVAAVGKEVYDRRSCAGHWCWKDILADAVGVVLGSVVHGLILLLIL